MNEIDFHPNGRYLLSSSNDSTLKIWDLRQGHILYTLYGHEGASTSAAFSPCGDYFTTGGADSVVMVWKSNLDENEQEFIEDFGAKSGDDGRQQAGGVPPVNQRRPPTSTRKAAKMSSALKSKGSPERSVLGGASKMGGAAAEFAQEPQAPADDSGVPGTGEELAQTLEKVVSQLDIISRTLNVLEQRVSMNEESVSNVMAYFNELRAQKESAQQQAYVRQMNVGYSSTQGHVINAYSAGGAGLAAQGTGAQNTGSQRNDFDAAMSFNQTLQNQQSSAEQLGPMAGGGGFAPQRPDGNGPGNQMGSLQQPGMREQTQSYQQQYQGDRPDMDSDDNNAEDGLEQPGRAEDTGEEFNAREQL